MKTVKVAAIAASVGQIAAILFLFFAGLVLRKNDDPLKMSTAVSYLAAALSALLCGVVTVFAAKENRIPAALLGGGLMVLITVLLSLFPGGGGKSLLQELPTLLLQAAVPAVLCLLFRNRTPGKSAGRKRARKRYAGR